MSGRIIVIGASLSGINALCDLVGRLPWEFPAPILITQHVAPHSPGALPEILSHFGKMPAVHPESGEPIKPGRIYVAPPDRHMLVERGYIQLSHGPRENLVRPAIDPLFRSAALAYGAAVVGVVLTGQLNDGTTGLLAIKDRGGVAVVQDPTEATAPGMPLSALQHVAVNYRRKLADMAPLLIDLAGDPPAGTENAGALELMQIEDRIARGDFNLRDWWNLERMSAPAGLNCPECHSVLYELNEKRIVRFRCRSGHAYSAQCLLSGQLEARESQLSAMFASLVEEATLIKRLRADVSYGKDDGLVHNLESRVALLEQEATKVAEWLHTLTGLVEPG